MDDPDELALPAGAEALCGIRRDLMRYLAGLPRAGSIIAMQRMLLREHAQTSRTQAGRDLVKDHRSKLRAIGDALAWQVLPAHTIRTLAKHPHRPAPPPVDGEDAAFVMHVVERLARAGRVPIISDLTSVLLVGDIVALGPGGTVEIVECKNTRIPTRLPSSGRLARQRQRGEALAHYLRESTMPYADEARRFAGALGIPAAVSLSPNLVAMDMTLPEPHPEWLDTAYARYEDSPHGVGIVEIGPGDYLMIANLQAIEGNKLAEAAAALPPLRQSCMAVHLEHLADPLPYCRSILSYPLDWKLRYDLLETNLVMIRLVDLAIFERRGEDGLGLMLQDDRSLLWARGDDYSQRFSNRFVHEVLTGPVSAAEMQACLLDSLRQVDRKLAALVMEPDRSGWPELLEPGSGTDVRYTTAYPAADGELAFVSSATEVGLGAVPDVTHVEYYPATGRLIVYDEDGALLDKEFPRIE
ncbi:hypothetical protein AB0B54_34840 [Microbispora bryophytorum]|uniref:hypothetical protein n=1 Tax=Microbispora bryophytorum TaxID=1460882 RepID=UPI003403D679